MTQTSTIIESYILEPGNMTRYDLVFTRYIDHHKGAHMCTFIWLNRRPAGVAFAWQEGSYLDASYVLDKLRGVSMGDLAPILIDIQSRFPGSLGALHGFDEYDENGCWQGKLSVKDVEPEMEVEAANYNPETEWL